VQDAARVRASVGVLTEQHGLYERMRGLEYLDFFGRIYRLPENVRHQRAEQLMIRFGLGDAFGKRVGEYSKGMKQKLALVRSLLHDPPVLLLDEPTSAMDPQSAKLVRDAIFELRQDKRTIILTTHNLTEAQVLADNIAVIRRGRIVAHGDMETLANRFVGPPVMELKTAQPLNGLANELGEMVKVVESGETWLRYQAQNPVETNPQVLRRVMGLGADVITLSQLTQTLEDVYLQIVEEDEGQEKKANEHAIQ
jgi:ABC-2 type transport system ATP-binding protein